MLLQVITKELQQKKWDSDTLESTGPEIVKESVSAASLLRHMKKNRVEYILLVIALHVIGVSDRLLAQLSGVCF